MAADPGEQAKLMKEIQYLTALIGQHKKPVTKPKEHVGLHQNKPDPFSGNKLKWSKNHPQHGKNVPSKKTSLSNVGGKPREPCGPVFQRLGIPGNRRETGSKMDGKKARVVISNKIKAQSAQSDEPRLLSVNPSGIKVSIQNLSTGRQPEVARKARTVFAPSGQSVAPWASQVTPGTLMTPEQLPVKQRPVASSKNSPSQCARKSLSKFKWFGGKADPGASGDTCKSNGVVPSHSILNQCQDSKPNTRTVLTSMAKIKTKESGLPKPLLTSTPTQHELSPSVPSTIGRRIPSRRRSSDTPKGSKTQTCARVICSKYKLHKVSLPQHPGVPSPNLAPRPRHKSVIVVNSRTKLVKKHIPIKTNTPKSGHVATNPFKSVTPKSGLVRNTRYKKVNHKSSTKHEMPRSQKNHIFKPKSSRYRYVRSLSNSSRTKSKPANWKSRYSLKRDDDMAMLIYLSRLLGKSGTNVSKNKYKFISSSAPPKRKIAQGTEFEEKRVKRLPSKSKLKLDRRKQSKPSTRGPTERFVVINGFVYKSSARKLVKTPGASSSSTAQTVQAQRKKRVVIRKLNHASMKTVTVDGVKFRMDQGGKTLQRIDQKTPGRSASPASLPGSSKMKHPITRLDIGGITYHQTKPGTLVRATNLRNRIMASHAVQRSKAFVMTQKSRQTKRQYCLYYQRFGRCNRGDKCPYIHDPDKVAVCKRFLRGTCSITDCLFSHKLTKERMPVCSYFLRGVCTKENCPYLHVNVNKDAEVCKAFLNGYCSLGEKCKKKHTLVCQEFINTGKCSAGSKCKLVHPKARKRPRAISTPHRPAKRRALLKKTDPEVPVPSTSTASPARPTNMPKLQSMPSFIALEQDEEDILPSPPTQTTAKPALQIRPNFT